MRQSYKSERMPSQAHEMLLLLFRNRPSLAPELLRQALGVELPEYSEVRLESAELTDVVPTEYRADLVVLLVEGKAVLGIVVEVQLRADAQKRSSWPAYVANLRARLGCACCLLVITSSNQVARWASEPIEIGPGFRLVPLVVGPEGVPVVTDPEEAKREPELAVLSVMAHGQGDPERAVKVALSAIAGTEQLAEEERMLYSDLILAALSDAARKAFAMLPHSYEFQSPIYKQGKLEGKAQMAAALVLEALEIRGIELSASQRERVESSADLAELRVWHRRAVVVSSGEELFEESAS